MSAANQFEYSQGELRERPGAPAVGHKGYSSARRGDVAGYSMLKARLPTQRELTELYHEVESLRKDKKLKDDTIKFLQKEKEALMRELQHYEQLCEGVVTDITSHRELEAENKQLQADILHLKDVVRRQNSLLRNTSTSGSNHLDRQLMTRLCSNLMSLLADVKTGMSRQVSQEIEHQKESAERSSARRGETSWHLLEIIDRAVLELNSESKRANDLPDISKPAPAMKYTHGGMPSNEPRHPSTNLTKTSSASFSNLSSPEPLSLAGQGKKRAGNSSGKLGRLGRMERSKSAPSLNGMVPRPPPSPAPSNTRNIYDIEPERPLTANVNMLDTLMAHPPGADY